MIKKAKNKRYKNIKIKLSGKGMMWKIAKYIF